MKTAQYKGIQPHMNEIMQDADNQQEMEKLKELKSLLRDYRECVVKWFSFN